MAHHHSSPALCELDQTARVLWRKAILKALVHGSLRGVLLLATVWLLMEPVLVRAHDDERPPEDPCAELPFDLRSVCRDLLFCEGFSGPLYDQCVADVLGISLGAEFQEPVACDTTLLEGVYGFNAEGVIRPDGRGKIEYASVGVIELRADGSVTVNLRETLGGQPESESQTFEGIYTVNEDCTGQADFEGTNWAFVAFDNGAQLSFVTVRDRTTIVADAARVFNGR